MARSHRWITTLILAGILDASGCAGPLAPDRGFDRASAPLAQVRALGDAVVGRENTSDDDRVMDLARQRERSGNLSEAKNLFQQVLEANPHHVDARHRLAVILAKEGELDRAERHLQIAHRGRPHDVEILNDLGYCRFLQGRIDEAATAYREALAIDPNHRTVRNNLAATQKAPSDEEGFPVPAPPRPAKLAKATIAQASNEQGEGEQQGSTLVWSFLDDPATASRASQAVVRESVDDEPREEAPAPAWKSTRKAPANAKPVEPQPIEPAESATAKTDDTPLVEFVELSEAPVPASARVSSSSTEPKRTQRSVAATANAPKAAGSNADIPARIAKAPPAVNPAADRVSLPAPAVAPTTRAVVARSAPTATSSGATAANHHYRSANHQHTLRPRRRSLFSAFDGFHSSHRGDTGNERAAARPPHTHAIDSTSNLTRRANQGLMGRLTR